MIRNRRRSHQLYNNLRQSVGNMGPEPHRWLVHHSKPEQGNNFPGQHTQWHTPAPQACATGAGMNYLRMMSAGPVPDDGH